MRNELTGAVDALPGLVWIVLPDGRAEFVDQRWREYTGLSAEEASVEGWHTAVHPDDRTAWHESWRTIVASGKPGEAEVRMRRFDDTYRWFLIRVSPLTDAAGEVVRWCGINTEIEGRRPLEDALRAYEQRFRLIMDGLPVPVVLLTPAGDFKHGNRLALDYFGVHAKELEAWATSDLIHPDDRAAALAGLKSSLKSGEPHEAETRYRLTNGIYHWFHVRGFPLRDDEGRVILWYFLLTDVDNRKQAEALLASEKHLLEMVALGHPLSAVLDALCRLADELAGGCRCCIMLIDPVRKNFQWGAVHGLEPGYVESLNNLLASGENSPCGTAASLLSQVIVEDVAADPRWTQRWRDLSLAYGLRSFWSTPIMSRTNVALGTFAIFLDQPSKPTPFQHDLIRQVTHIASIAVERARNDVSLKRSEESLRAFVETTTECVKVFTRDGTLLLVNSAGAAMTGAGCADDLIGMCVYDIVAPEHRQQYIEFNEGICSGRWGFLEFDILTMQGERRHMETHAAPMEDGDGSIVQLAVTRDITTRKQAEEQLRRSEALMAKAQQLSSSGSFYWRLASGEIIWSDQTYRIFDYDPRIKMTLELIAARLHPDDLHVMQGMTEHAQDGKDFAYEHRLRLPDGSIKYLQMLAHAAHDKQGRLEYIGAVQDVTELRRFEEGLGKLRAELAHVSRINSLGALTASIAHEINQPLAGIVTNAGTCLRMLNADPPNIADALETARRTIRDGRRASEVITRLRALFSNKAVITNEVNLNEAANEVVELLRSEIRRNRVVLHLDLATDLPPVSGDRVQLQQVVLNLLLNGVEAMSNVNDNPRQMLVRTGRDNSGQVRFAVTDNGVGIEPQSAGKLFDAFYTTKKDGMGIGLSVSRSIVESHGGCLSATANEGAGATFSFSIPCYSGYISVADHPGVQHLSATATTSRAENI